VYHVTTATVDRWPTFYELAAARVVARCVNSAVLLGDAKTLCWMLMPDHLHWLLRLGDEHELATIVRRVKGASAIQINRLVRRPGGAVWAPSFHDHAMRREEDLVTTAQYIVANPVRAGLVDSHWMYPHWDCIWDLPWGRG
jgi:putative transposase